MALVIRRLEAADEVENFDCGDEPLNNYLKRHAWSNQEKILIGVSYVAVDEGASRDALSAALALLTAVTAGPVRAKT